MVRSLVLALALSLTLAPPRAAAQEPTPVEPLRELSRELGPGERHVYGLRLDAGQFVLGHAEQRGIDVVVTVLGPAGEPIGEFDGPARGPETFTFVSERAGEYRIAIAPFLDDETGDYTIELLRTEPVAATPSGRVDQLFAAWTQAGSPGAAVAVAQDGRIVHEAGYGLAQLEYDVPITPATVFHVASVSKQVTAFAIAMLAEAGELSLDDDVRRYVPELPDFGHTITIRHLLHHTSGLRDQWNLLALAGWRLDDVITTDQILRLVSRQRELNFVPGAEYLYCNTGYTLLGEIVARVSGRTLAEWTAEHLFEPLGMTSTHFHDDHEMIVPHRAYSYAYAPDGGYRKDVLSYANAGATSLFTTAGDLARWMHNLETGKLGGPRVRDMMHRRGVLNDGDTITYALGLVHGAYRGVPTVGHGGADAGFRSQALRFPEQGLAVAVLSNLASFNSGGMARRIADVYLEDELGPREVVAAAAEDDDEVDRAAVAPEVLARYVGEYDLMAGLTLTVTLRDGRLFGTPTDQEELELIPRSDSVFTVPQVGAELTFETVDFREVRLVVRAGGQTLRATRRPPFDPEALDLSRYVGVFDSPELETTYEIVLEEGALIARHVRHDPIALEAQATDRFRGDAWFFRTVEFERGPDGVVRAMRVSSGRVRNLLFVKREGGRVRR